MVVAAAQPLRTVPLSADRQLVVRHVRPDDAAGLMALYETLDEEDHYHRFFSSYRPKPAFFAELANVAAVGGRRLVGVVLSGERSRIVAEAGYTRLPNGDGELAITVERPWRGWLGPYLLDALADAAAEAGVPNLEAEVLLVNRPMLGLLRSRGAVVMERQEWSVMRLLMGTGERQPTWPGRHERPRILIEGPSGRWRADCAGRLDDADVLTCPGPRPGAHGCPLLIGGRCLLASAADEIIVTHAADDERWEALAVARRAAGLKTSSPLHAP